MPGFDPGILSNGGWRALVDGLLSTPVSAAHPMSALLAEGR